MAHITNKATEILEKFYLVKIGMQVCDGKILPMIIARVEPEEDSAIKPPVFAAGKGKNALKEPNTVVTFMEADEIIGRYQLIFLLILYSAVPILGVLGYLVSLILESVDSLIMIPNWVEPTIYLSLLIAFIAFWTGVLIPLNKRTEIWKEARNNELEIQKLEHFAMNRSSKIMAKILFEIEKLKDVHKEEMDRVIKISKKRTVLDVETMKMFNEMMDEREREIRKKGNMKAALLGMAGFVAGYAFEKYFDYLLFGATPNFMNPNK